jgi:hypothetical protein
MTRRIKEFLHKEDPARVVILSPIPGTYTRFLRVGVDRRRIPSQPGLRFFLLFGRQNDERYTYTKMLLALLYGHR